MAEATPSLSWARRYQVRAGLVGFSIFLVAGFAVGRWRDGRAPAVTQPIAFNHQLHVEQLELSCDTCHESFARETFSGFPGADICGDCHSEAQGESAEEAKLVARLAAGEGLAWERLFSQPAHVFYSHRRHVGVARLECTECHGTFAATTRPPQRVKGLTMDDCIDCHRQRGARTDCTACHR